MIEIIGSAVAKGYGKYEALNDMKDIESLIISLKRETSNDLELNTKLKKEIGIRTLAISKMIQLFAKAFTTKGGINNVDCKRLLTAVIQSNMDIYDNKDYILAGERRIGNNHNNKEATQLAVYELTKTNIMLKLVILFSSNFNDNFSLNDVNKIYNGGEKSSELILTCMEVYADKLISACMN